LAVAGAEATEVRLATRSVAANDVDRGNCGLDGAKSFEGAYKPA